MTDTRPWPRKSAALGERPLRDIGLVKLFFADTLDRDEAMALLGGVKRRSEARVATLRSIEPAARRAEQDGNVHLLLTLRMGIAFHQAMIEVSREFEDRFGEPDHSQDRRRHE